MTAAASAESMVLQGRNGRLFLARQDSFDIRRFVDGTLPSPTVVARWCRTLRRRAAELAALGIPYLFFIVPDAPTVHPEDLPSGFPAAAAPPGARLAAALQGIPNLMVVYPLNDIKEAKGGLPVFRKTDTHWSGYGAFVAYRTLCRALAQFVPVTPIAARDLHFGLQNEFGDLGSLVTPERSGFNVALRTEGQGFCRGPVRPGPFRSNSQVFHARNGNTARLLVLRDSFMTEQAPLLAATFGTTELVGTTSRLFLEHVRQTRPDVVVTEICERRLTEWENDSQLCGFEEMFGTDWTTDTGRIALAAEMALDGGHVARAADAVARLLAQEDLLEPSHRFVAARACIANGAMQDAMRLIGSALAADPERPAYLCVAAQVSLALGDGAAAVELARRACAAAPWNGHMHEVLGYVLLMTQQPREAVAAIAAAEQRIDDHPNLFMVGSMAAEQCGDGPNAVRCMAQCLELWPDNPAYVTRMADLLARPDVGKAAPEPVMAP